MTSSATHSSIRNWHLAVAYGLPSQPSHIDNLGRVKAYGHGHREAAVRQRLAEKVQLPVQSAPDIGALHPPERRAQRL